MDDSWLSPITQKWLSLGGQNGLPGYPTTGETVTPDGVGRFVHFQGGSIYWHPGTGAFEVYGLIRNRWTQLNREKGIAGYPTSGELDTADKKGRYNRFQNCRIYYHPSFGTYDVCGNILNQWLRSGGETGKYGYPTGTRYRSGAHWIQPFEKGKISD